MKSTAPIQSAALEEDAPPAYLGPMSIARLDSRALIRISGPDARPFLHNLLTQDVETIKPGELRFGALLSPPGRLLFDLFIWGEEDGVVLDVAAERRDALIQRLTLYKLRADVAVMPIPDTVFVAWGADVPEGFVADPRLPALGGRRWGDQSEADATEADWQAHRLALGAPDPTADALMDKTYPIEANFDLLNGIDFHKGCFIGQETTSRMKRRGTIKNRMMAIAFDGPAPERGAEVLKGELRAGEVMTGAEGRAIALMRLDRMDGELTVDGRPVQVEQPDWIPDL